MKVRDVIQFLEMIAPPSLQESYDNAQLLVGDPGSTVTGILCTLDATEEIVEEAISRGCNLIVAHHPIVFVGLKSLTGRNYVERTVIKAIQNRIGIYAIHTNLDNVLSNGVNQKLADIIGLQNQRILRPKSNAFSRCQLKLKGNIEKFKNKFNDLDCSTLKITGKDEEGSIIDFHTPVHSERKLATIFQGQDEILWVRFFNSNFKDFSIGSGLTGELKAEMDCLQFFDLVKKKLKVPFVKHTKLLNKRISKVALCGGSGSFLLKDAIAQGADVFLTSDYKYHEYFDAEEDIIILDVGHYETEQFTRDLLTDLLNKNGFKALLSTVNTNPVHYY